MEILVYKDTRNKVVIVRLSGVVNIGNCSNIYNRLLEVSPGHLAPNVLYDLARVTDIDLTFDQMSELVGLRRQYYSQSINARIGIWAPSDMTFGMSRMYSSLIEQFKGVRTGVFRCQQGVSRYLEVPVAELFETSVAPAH